MKKFVAALLLVVSAWLAVPAEADAAVVALRSRAVVVAARPVIVARRAVVVRRAVIVQRAVIVPRRSFFVRRAVIASPVIVNPGFAFAAQSFATPSVQFQLATPVVPTVQLFASPFGFQTFVPAVQAIGQCR